MPNIKYSYIPAKILRFVDVRVFPICLFQACTTTSILHKPTSLTAQEDWCLKGISIIPVVQCLLRLESQRKTSKPYQGGPWWQLEVGKQLTSLGPQ